jgi:hypothetical protein
MGFHWNQQTFYKGLPGSIAFVEKAKQKGRPISEAASP